MTDDRPSLHPWWRVMQTLPPTIPAQPRPIPDWYAPVRSDLAEVERVLAQTLRSPRACVTRLLSHLENYRGKRLRPALLLLTARACGRVVPAHHILGAVV